MRWRYLRWAWDGKSSLLDLLGEEYCPLIVSNSTTLLQKGKFWLF
jgi:hypothetical protein